MGVQLQDVPRGQVVAGSVFLRNPSNLNALCSTKADFTLSSEKDFVLLSLQVTSLYSPLWLLSNSHPAPLWSAFCALARLPLPHLAWLPFLFLSPSLTFSFCPVSDLLPLPITKDLPRRSRELWPLPPPQWPRGPAGGPVSMAEELSVQKDRCSGRQPSFLLSPRAPLSAD